MKKLCVLIVVLICVSCFKKQSKAEVTSKKSEFNQAMDNEFLYKKDNAIIEIIFKNFKYSIKTNLAGIKTIYDLDEMHIPTKTPNKLTWANDNYACMMVWWSQSQSRHIFIPTNPRNKFIYLDKDIEESDSLSNNIVYIDSVYYEKDYVKFTVENLITRKTISLNLKYGPENGTYPFYDSISLTKNRFEVFSRNENKKIDITSINNGT